MPGILFACHVHVLCVHAATSFDDLAVLRSSLERLDEKIKSTVHHKETEGLADHVKLCVEKCRLVFDKVGKEVKSYKQTIKQLQEEKDHYHKELQHLKGRLLLHVYTKVPSECTLLIHTIVYSHEQDHACYVDLALLTLVCMHVRGLR